MVDLDKLSYQAYGNLVIGVLLVIAVLINLVPSFSLFSLIVCISQIPIYLLIRGHLEEPIHAEGLNICFVLTILFYILLFLVFRLSTEIIGAEFSVALATITNAIGCYFTSTKSTGKLFYGYKKHSESKYDKLINYIKYNGLNQELLDAEERLSKTDIQVYLIYKRKFREDKTFKEINEEFEIENGRIVEILDKAYFYIIGALKI